MPRLARSWLPLAVVCALCLLPALLHSFGVSSSSLVAAAVPRNTAGSTRTATTGTATATAARPANADADDDDEPRRSATHADTDDEDAPEAPHTLKLRIEHSLGTGAFTPRGDVTLNFNPTKRGSTGATKAITFSPSQQIATKQLKDALTASDSSALYRVRFLVDDDTSSSASAVLASVPACALVASHFHETFTFHCDPYGALLSVTYRTPIASCLAAKDQDGVLASTGAQGTFATKGKISFGRPGEKAKLNVRPGFDAAAQAAAQAMGAEGAPAAPAATPTKADGAQPPQEEKGFFAKYWMYIVALIVFMMIQAVMAPPEGPPGQRPGGPAPPQAK